MAKLGADAFEKKTNEFMGAIPIKPDTFSSNIRYESLIRWSFALTFAKLQELLSNSYQGMDQKAFPFNVMVLTFEKTLAPLMDDEFKKQIARINSRFMERYNGIDFWMDASYGLEHLEATVTFLHRVGLLDSSAPQLIPEVDVDEALDDLDEGDE